MAKAKQKKKSKNTSVEMTLWDVILSYPVLSKPKTFKGKDYFSTDVLFEKGHPDLKKLQAAIDEVCIEAFGEDESEWPAIKGIQSGNDRQDSETYKGRRFITASTNAEFGAPPVVGPDGRKFNPAMAKGGMFANVAIQVKAWEYDGDEGVSIYLQGVQVDTDKDPLSGFGGGKSVNAMFNIDGDGESNDSSDEDEDEEEAPRRSKSKKRPVKDEDEEEDFDDEDSSDDEEDEEPAPRRSSSKKKKPSRSSRYEEEDDEN